MQYENVLILGGGKYGTIALKVLSKESKKIIVVDKDPSCRAGKFLRLSCSDPSRCDMNFRLIVDDALRYMFMLMKRGDPPNLIVPTVPGNVMARLFSAWLSDLGLRVETDQTMVNKALAELPRETIIKADPSTGTVVASYARDFRCLLRCKEPEICPVTGKRNPESMYTILSRLSFCNYNKIFRSKLVADDVGAIDGKEVYHELMILPKKTEGYTLCVGTACRCHGIINFLRTFEGSGLSERKEDLTVSTIEVVSFDNTNV
ncbi:MAG: hypothetical protein ACUVQ5_01750 [Candidatus Methanomethylicaceae archaeon]